MFKIRKIVCYGYLDQVEAEFSIKSFGFVERQQKKQDNKQLLNNTNK